MNALLESWAVKRTHEETLGSSMCWATLKLGSLLELDLSMSLAFAYAETLPNKSCPIIGSIDKARCILEFSRKELIRLKTKTETQLESCSFILLLLFL